MAYSIKNMAYGKNEMEHTVIVRLHRASHDSAQNGAEHTNAAIGEALTTGRPVEPPADPFYGLTASQMDSMTLKELKNIARHGKWRILGSWREKSQIEFLISLGLGSTVRHAIHFFVNFDIFKWLYLAYYWVYLHQTWGFCKSRCALSDHVDQ